MTTFLLIGLLWQAGIHPDYYDQFDLHYLEDHREPDHQVLPGLVVRYPAFLFEDFGDKSDPFSSHRFGGQGVDGKIMGMAIFDTDDNLLSVFDYNYSLGFENVARFYASKPREEAFLGFLKIIDLIFTMKPPWDSSRKVGYPKVKLTEELFLISLTVGNPDSCWTWGYIEIMGELGPDGSIQAAHHGGGDDMLNESSLKFLKLRYSSEGLGWSIPTQPTQDP